MSGPPPRRSPAVRPPANNPYADGNLGGGRDRGRGANQRQQQHEEEQPMETYENEIETEEEEKPRYKYSTASMRQGIWGGRCLKYCCILCMFLIFMAISMGISILIQKIFFPEDDPAAGGGEEAVRPENDTFPMDKSVIDAECSSSSFDLDGGMQCKTACRPNFFECCNPFNEYKLYNISNDPLGDKNFDLNCSLSMDTRGCMAYSKCQAASGMNDPAVATLPILCTSPRLEMNPQACMDLCDRQRCCYNNKNTYGTALDCTTFNFDVCMDFAPCQNLRQPNVTLQTASSDLDHLCWTGQERCGEECEKAKCCSTDINVTDSCLRDNFITCLTYAACTESNLTATNITLPTQFSVVPPPPAELITVCNVNGINTEGQDLATCKTHCQQSDCCRESPSLGGESCFYQDPLGCLEWNYQCSVNDVQQN